MKSLGHTGLVEPHIVFKSEISVKPLPFSTPQSIQEHAKEQFAQLVDTNITERNISEWTYPMLMVRKKASPDHKPSFRMALEVRVINAIIQGSEAEIGLLQLKNKPLNSGVTYPLCLKPYMGFDLPRGTRQQYSSFFISTS